MCARACMHLRMCVPCMHVSTYVGAVLIMHSLGNQCSPSSGWFGLGNQCSPSSGWFGLGNQCSPSSGWFGLGNQCSPSMVWFGQPVFT